MGWPFFKHLAERRWFAIFLVFVFALALNAAVSFWIAWPEPHIHDEFSYLLAGDTFAHGRMTNPAHPMWEHLETFHVNSRPTYASMYPPAQGLTLALGQVLSGQPILGVWLGAALACAAICWMLQAWLPARWALLGGLMALIHPGLLSWGQSYWGGSVAACGGALVFGAIPRIIRKARLAEALVLALGLVILANSRPFEGMVVGLVGAGLLLGWIVTSKREVVSLAIKRFVLPCVLILGFAAAAMAYYNFRLTGNPALLPYQANGGTYAITPIFLWQPLAPEPHYRHEVMQDYHVGWAKAAYVRMRTPSGYAQEVADRLATLFRFYLGPALMVPLFALPWILRNPWMQFAALACAMLSIALLQTTWLQPHYAAPITCLTFVLVVQGMRQLRVWKLNGKRIGKPVFVAVLIAYLGLFAQAVLMRAQSVSHTWYDHRAQIANKLERTGGKHVVIVQYRPNHSAHQEWVYNAADIDGAAVVWARDMGAQKNQELADYFKGRHIWLIDADGNPDNLAPYPDPHPDQGN